MDIHMDMSPAEYGAIKTMAKRQGLRFKDHYASKDNRLMFSTIKLGDENVMYIHKLKNHTMHRKVMIHDETYSRTLFRVSGEGM